MRAIYQGSVCTIAATAASNSQEGCFWGRSLCVIQHCIVHIDLEGLLPGDYILELENYRDRILEESPLLQRAWAFQERVLSPRVLHFGKTQFIWECLELEACEKYPGGINGVDKLPVSLSAFHKGKYTPILETSMTSTRLATAEQETPNPILSVNKILKIWWSFVLHYSKGSLTKPRDKLVAIAGLARLVASLIDSDYLAGLWRTDLPGALLWRIRDGMQSNGKPPERPLPYRAPSWSWPSVDGELRQWGAGPWGADPWGCERRFGDAEIIEAHVHPVTDDRFGQICGGAIRLRGLLRTVSAYDCAGKRGLAFADESRILGVVSFDCESDILGTSLHLIIICSDPDASGPANSTLVYGLILRPTGHRPGEFRRVGLASVWKDGLGLADSIEWIEGLGNKEWLEYEECNDQSRYTITII